VGRWEDPVSYLAVSSAAVSRSVFHITSENISDSHLPRRLRSRQNSSHCSGLASSMVVVRRLQVAAELGKVMLTVK